MHPLLQYTRSVQMVQFVFVFDKFPYLYNGSSGFGSQGSDEAHFKGHFMEDLKYLGQAACLLWGQRQPHIYSFAQLKKRFEVNDGDTHAIIDDRKLGTPE